jgi:hypothetical protein
VSTASAPPWVERARAWLFPSVPGADGGAHDAMQLPDAARRLFSDANDLASRQRQLSALLLYREGFQRLAEAKRLVPGVDAKTPDRECVKSMFAKPEDAASILEADFSLLEPRKRRLLLRAARRAARRLDTYLRSDLGWTRRSVAYVRLALLFAATTLLVPWAVRQTKWPHNVALGKPVVASSVRFGDASALTNGAIEWGTFGLHTNGGGAFAVIDLGDFYSLKEARVFGRGDGHFWSGFPLLIEASDDGIAYRGLGVCHEQFTQAVPCEVTLGGTRARFVRVRASELVLSEVEVLGDR